MAAKYECHVLMPLPHQEDSPFLLARNLGWPWGLLWPIGSSTRDAVPVIGLALKKPNDFCFHSLGTQAPGYKEVQPVLQDRGTMWRGPERRSHMEEGPGIWQMPSWSTCQMDTAVQGTPAMVLEVKLLGQPTELRETPSHCSSPLLVTQP